MSNNECPVCFKKYNKEENKPYILECGDTLCLKCINNYKEALQKETFECSKCCKNTKSLGIMNRAIPLDDNQGTNNNKDNNNNSSTDGFFVNIKLKNGEKISIKVKKEYTINQLKQMISDEKNIEFKKLNLSYKRPLLNGNKTLESYGITKTVTVIQISDLVGGK